MCGIAGIVSLTEGSVTKSRVKRMTDKLVHRGPDSEGQWVDTTGKIGLGHRRLSILDLSDAAIQPMHYLQRYSVVFNGEIYNYLELKQTLLDKGYLFNSTSDTEVLLAYYDYKGDRFLEDLNGMFAFALYDKKENTILFARDRFGEKPFYYTRDGGEFFFASEMKALWAIGLQKKMSDKYVYNFLEFGLLTNPDNLTETFYEGINSLEHSHFLKLSMDTFEIKIEKYFDIDYDNINRDISYEEARIKFRDLLYDSVSLRLRSDVPVGTSLSGGLDSSTLVAMVDKLKTKDQEQKSFSAVFPGFEKDESKYIQMVIDSVSSQSFFVEPDQENYSEHIHKIAYHQEEPFASNSIFAQYLVMRLARDNDVTVLIDGQGADEILAGYHFYYFSYFAEQFKESIPELYKRVNEYNRLHDGNEINRRFSKMDIALSSLFLNYFSKLYKNVRNKYHLMKKGSVFEREFLMDNRDKAFNFQFRYKSLNEALYESTMRGKLQELLRYADRNSMAFSREVRLPFLDHRLVEFLFTLPSEFKISSGWTKYILRDAISDLIPKEIAWRKDKIGYETTNKNKTKLSDIEIDSFKKWSIDRSKVDDSLNWRMHQLQLASQS